MEDLIQKIEQWAEDRNLINGCTSLDQSMKLFSEFGELADAVAKDDLEGIKDGIGDVFVSMAIMCRQVGTKLNLIADEYLALHDNPKRNVAWLGYWIHSDCSELFLFNLVGNELFENCISYMANLADHYDLTLKKCVEHAYNEIKDRKGIMHNGTFIKESDARYKQLVGEQ